MHSLDQRSRIQWNTKYKGIWNSNICQYYYYNAIRAGNWTTFKGTGKWTNAFHNILNISCKISKLSVKLVANHNFRTIKHPSNEHNVYRLHFFNIQHLSHQKCNILKNIETEDWLWWLLKCSFCSLFTLWFWIISCYMRLNNEHWRDP